MSIYKKLLAIQTELKAPKNQFNKFGNYKYRNCEDILEGVKPLLKQNNVTIMIHDEVEFIHDRYYIKAIVNFIDIETGEKISTSAFAREEESKKGMDGSQVTGASSSYARKYALNGLLAIDDAKDSDTTNTGKDKDNKKTTEPKKETDFKKEIVSILIALYGKDKAQDKLLEHTSFVGKDKKEVAGVRETSKLSDARARATYGKLKEVYREVKKTEWESGKNDK